MSRMRKVKKEAFVKIVQDSNSLRDIILHFGLPINGGNYKTLKRIISEYKLDISHFGYNGTIRTRKRNDEIFIKGSTYNNSNLKKRIINENLVEYVCADVDCSNTGEWNSKKLVLQLDHINGDSRDNRIENLRFLCPNCHSQTVTYSRSGTRGKRKKEKEICPECGHKKYYKSEMCRKCSNDKIAFDNRRVERPTKEELQTLIENNTWLALGKMFGVSDNSIRKWARSYNLI